jgi:hypothetical protein
MLAERGRELDYTKASTRVSRKRFFLDVAEMKLIARCILRGRFFHACYFTIKFPALNKESVSFACGVPLNFMASGDNRSI